MVWEISQTLAARSSGRILWWSLVAMVTTFWMFNFSKLPFSNPELIRVSGESLFDVRWFYTPAQALEALSKFGEAGRQIYFSFLALDFLFPLIYALALSLLLSKLLRLAGQERYLPLNLLPLLAAAFDYLENIHVLAMLLLFPSVHPALAMIAATGTLMKQVFLLMSLLLLVLVSCRAVWLRLRPGGV